jgi:cytochrome P450
MAIDAELREYPFEPFRGDLPAEVVAMVRDEPVSRVRLLDGRPCWLVLGYREVLTVLSDPRFSRRVNEVTSVAGCPRELGMDGSAHATLRRLAARAFSPRRIESYRPRVRAIAEELLDAVLAAGPPADLVAGLVAPLPALAVYELLGVPSEDRDRFATWTVDLLALTAYGTPEAARADAELRDYLAERVAAKHVEPGADLLSAWVEEQRTSDLTDAEIVGLGMGVLLGGREINSTSAGLRALFLHPEQLAALRADPGLVPGAVTEILRYTTVSSMFLVQRATEDVALAGIPIAAGDWVMAVPWAANRDGSVFPDPETFDIRRAGSPLLTFGHGPHFCLGAALGRMEMEVELDTLLRRMPDLRPAVALDALPWREDRFNCGMAEFPVTW